jgi:hypothetical protein
MIRTIEFDDNAMEAGETIGGMNGLLARLTECALCDQALHHAHHGEGGAGDPVALAAAGCQR